MFAFYFSVMASRSMIIREAGETDSSDEVGGDLEDVLPIYHPDDEEQYRTSALAEDERKVSEYFREKEGSDFVFVTHYPRSKRPFYAMPDPKDPELTVSFDLLFRGLEVTTGGERIHDYDMLSESIKSRGLDPKNFEYYLQAFAYGMPLEGGLAIGLERLTARLINVDNVRIFYKYCFFRYFDSY